MFANELKNSGAKRIKTMIPADSEIEYEESKDTKTFIAYNIPTFSMTEDGKVRAVPTAINNPIRDSLIVTAIGQMIELTNDQKKDKGVRKMVLEFFKKKGSDIDITITGGVDYLGTAVRKFAFSTPPPKGKLDMIKFISNPKHHN